MYTEGLAPCSDCRTTPAECVSDITHAARRKNFLPHNFEERQLYKTLACRLLEATESSNGLENIQITEAIEADAILDELIRLVDDHLPEPETQRNAGKVTNSQALQQNVDT